MSGYDQFFKAAKQNRIKAEQSQPAKPPRKKVPKKVQKKAKRKKHQVSVVGSVISMGLVLMALVGLFSIDKSGDFLSSLEVGMFSQANAVGEAASKLAAKVKKGAKNSKTGSKSDSESSAKKKPEIKIVDSEEISYLSELRERKEELDRREKSLVELESQLQEQKKMLDAKIKELVKVRNEIASVLKDRIDYDDEKIGKLVDFYSNMKPQQAAQIFQEINEDLAVEVLGRMKKKNAADIMNLLRPEKAQVLSEKFAGYQKR